MRHVALLPDPPGRPRRAGESARASLLGTQRGAAQDVQTSAAVMLDAFKEWWATQPTEAEFTEVMEHALLPSAMLYAMVTHPFTAPARQRGSQPACHA